MRNFFLLLILLSISSAGICAYVPATKISSPAAFHHQVGKQQSTLKQYLKYKKMRKRGIFPERDELTEGFQALPFFASLLTFGLVSFIMLFTARDSNALKWALLGGSIGLLVITLFSVMTSGLQ